MRRYDLACQTEILELSADHDLSRHLRQRYADRFADERHGAGSPRVYFQHEYIGTLHGELHVHQTAYVERPSERDGMAADFVLNFPADGFRRQTACAIAGVHSGALDMLHNAADNIIV